MSSLNKKPKITRSYNLFLISFSLTYGAVLQFLPLLAFQDRQNYLNYAGGSFNILENHLINGSFSVLANEPLWLLFNISLGQFFEPEIVVRIVIFSGASLLSYLLIRVNPKNSIWLMLFLLMPQLLKNHVTHLRQGLAMALFYAGYLSGGSTRRWGLMVASSFVHASFFFILPLVALPEILKKMHFAIDVRLFAVIGFAVLISLFMGLLASVVGARQSVHNFEMASVSGLGFVFWLIVIGLFIANGKEWLENNQEAAAVLIFYLVSYFLVEVTARIFESGMPLVLLSGLVLTGWRRLVFICMFLLYGAIQWNIRLSSPMLF